MKKNKLYIYFFILSSFFLLLSFYWRNFNTQIDINIHDTYYVILNSHLSILFALFYALIGFIYLIFKISKIKINTILTKIHSIITLGAVPLYYIGLEIIKLKPESNFPLFDDVSNSNSIISVIGILFIFAQLLLILNIIFSLLTLLIKKK